MRWKFPPTSLYSSIKYLISNIKNIKNSLNCMAKYINNKQIDPKRSNDIEDLKGVDKEPHFFNLSVKLGFASC